MAPTRTKAHRSPILKTSRAAAAHLFQRVKEPQLSSSTTPVSKAAPSISSVQVSTCRQVQTTRCRCSLIGKPSTSVMAQIYLQVETKLSRQSPIVTRPWVMSLIRYTQRYLTRSHRFKDLPTSLVVRTQVRQAARSRSTGTCCRHC